MRMISNLVRLGLIAGGIRLAVRELSKAGRRAEQRLAVSDPDFYAARTRAADQAPNHPLWDKADSPDEDLVTPSQSSAGRAKLGRPRAH